MPKPKRRGRYLRMDMSRGRQIIEEGDDYYGRGWHRTWWGLVIIGVLIAVISGAIVYFLGWT